MSYYYKKQVAMDFDQAVQRTKIMLGEQGFGVLIEINVNEILRKKLGVDFGNYIILGACSPSHAYKALKTEIDIGLLLPCNLIIYQDQAKRVFVSTIKPSVAMGMIKTPGLAEIADEVEIKLKKVIDSI